MPLRVSLTKRRVDNEQRQNESGNKELLSRRDPKQNYA